MSRESKQPIISQAFANDRDDRVDSRYLRNLLEEAPRLQSALARAWDQGLCRLIVHQNATVDDILDVFQHVDYRNRIALFHYGGHANSCQLLFETLDEYTTYARNVVTAERGGGILPCQAAFWAVRNADDRATEMGAEYLVQPLAEKVARYQPDWEVQIVLAEVARLCLYGF